MYRAFVVDDEETVRDGLEHYFDWEKFGVEIVGDADDGDVAFDRIMDCRPDFLVSDVKMPRMDGTVLVEKLWDAGMRIPVLFVSGYSEVRILKAAMRFQPEDYILKPIDLSELESAVVRIVERLDRDRARKEELGKMETLLYRSMPLLKEKYFLRLLGDGVKNDGSARSDLDFLGLDIDDEEPVDVFLLHIAEPEIFSDGNFEKERYLYSFAVQNVVAELIEREWKGFVCQEDREHLVGFVQSADLVMEAVTDFYERIRKAIFESLQISVSIAAGTIEAGVGGLSRSFKMAQSVCGDQFIHGSGVYVATNEQRRGPANMDTMYRLLENLHLDLGDYRDEGKIEARVEKIFLQLLSVDGVDEQDIKSFCFHFVQKIYLDLVDQNATDMENLKKQSETIGRIYHQTNVEGLKKCLISYFRETVQDMLALQNTTYGNVVSQVKRLLQNGYARQWTLDELAAEMNISKAYLCTLFKQSTGQTIMYYLAQLRIYKAADLLRNPTIKINEVGDMVGYDDPGYFTRSFKKHFGVSPSQYRKNLNI